MEVVLSPAIALYLLYRGIRDRRYFHGLRERLGHLPDSFQSTGAPGIWLHAVSVGEILSAVELARQLRAERPSVRIFVSTTTLTGRAIAEEKLSGIADGVFFAPLDYRSAVRRVLRRLRPWAVIVLETEIWPNLYRESKRAGASLLLMNGRISDRALPRYRRHRWFFRHVLRWPDAIFAQSPEDARRFEITGAPVDRVKIGGNLKYDFTPPAKGIGEDIAGFLDRTNPAKIWIAASTMAPASAGDVDEDDAAIAAFQKLAAKNPGLLMILVPRKPERFESAAAKLSAAGIPFVRRMRLDELKLPGVLLLDSIGELAALFERADLVFMGGTLADRGGHNILEPAYFGKPVIVGPHMENFAAIAKEFEAAHAAKQIARPEDLAEAAGELLADPGDLGSRARTVALSKRGVTGKAVAAILEAVDEGVPNPPRRLAARVVLTPLSWIWRAGRGIDAARQRSSRRTLKAPVVSIGGLAMGGVGKSPIVAHLARRLRERGRDPAILTRGYGRNEAAAVIVRRGEAALATQTGDEAQIFLRRADAHLGIGAQRYEIGAEIENKFHPDLFLLDDGFQHEKLARQQDIVLIDALDPLAGGVFPLGSLREPFGNIRRATAIIITRAEPGRSLRGLEKMIRHANPAVPIFYSRVIPEMWIAAQGGCEDLPAAQPGFHKVAGFCGLGNPDAFWRTLSDLKLDVALRRSFPDHHAYSSAEVASLAREAAALGAEVLVTTEKDSVNLPKDAGALVSPLGIFWLRIGIHIDNEDELLSRLMNLTSVPPTMQTKL